MLFCEVADHEIFLKYYPVFNMLITLSVPAGVLLSSLMILYFNDWFLLLYLMGAVLCVNSFFLPDYPEATS